MLFESLQIETLTDMFRLRARQQPEARACLYLLDSGLENGSYTYGELDRKIRSVAALVQEIASPGDRVLLLYPPGLDFIAAFFGCLYAGVVAVPAYPPKQNRHLLRLQAIVADADACAVLTTGDILGRVSRGLDEHPRLAGLAWRATDRGGLPQEDAFRPVPLTGDTLAFLQYTSGSTGQPKGVMVSHHNLLCNCDMIRSQWGLTEREVCVSWLPAFHDMGLIGMILTSLYLGAFIVLMAPVSFIQRPLIWLEAMSRYRGTFTAAPNFGYELCVKKITDEAAASLDLSSMRVAANGSEPVRASTLAAFAERFAPAGFPPEAAAPCYGLAEATLLAAGHSGVPELRSADRVALERHELQEPSDKASAAELVSCGPSSDRTRMAIVHPETREVCPDGTVGEIWLSGPSVALGYWRRPDVTAEVFQATLAGSGDGPFLRTGDLGFLDEGRLFVTGRIKDLILIRGRNLYPQDLELVSERSHPALLPGASAAFTVEIAGQERLVVVQEVARHTKDTGEAMASIRRAVFQEYDVSPYAVVLIRQSSLPKTSSGKIQRRAARAEFLEDQLTVVDQWREGEDLHNSAQTEAAAGMETAAALASERPGSEPGRNEAENGNGPAPAAIERWLTAELSRTLGLSPARIDPQRPFSDYGLDSVQAVELAGRFQNWLGRPVSDTLAWDFPGISAVARHFGAANGTGDLPGYCAGADRRETNARRTGRTPAKGTKAAGAERSLPACDSAGTDASFTGETGSAGPVAIVGIACRFPGAPDPDAFWSLLRQGLDAVGEVPADRFDLDRFFDPDAAVPGKTSSRWGGFLGAVDAFDPGFFGLSAREADSMDPQQRLLLELAAEALDDAGLPAASLAGSDTGVFVGISASDYSRRLFADPDRIDIYSGTGGALSIAANRLSYLLDLRGPSLAVDTACSSSLVAVHLACRALAAGEASAALVGGVNLILAPDLSINFAKMGAMAPDGRCKSFDARADGYVRGEGAGLLVLKTLEQARADGDRIYAVIRGSAVNQDGRSNGLTAPSRQAQEAVLRSAYSRAGVSPGDLRYVETHGTGTPLGDPIEAAALGAVLAEGRPEGQLCAIGSVKTNIGHLEAAAGVAGLIKTALALWHRELPASLHFGEANPRIPFDRLPLKVQTAPSAWPVEEPGEAPLAGVSSFGFGGTNAHVVLQAAWKEAAVSEENGGQPLNDAAPGAPSEPSDSRHTGREVNRTVCIENGVPAASDAGAPEAPDAPLLPLPLSAHSPAALADMARRYADYLDTAPASIGAIGYNAARRRDHRSFRLFVAGRSASEWAAALREALDERAAGALHPDAAPARPLRTAWVFSGHGGYWLGMAAGCLDFPVFAAVIDRCETLFHTLDPALPSLRTHFQPAPDSGNPADADDADAQLAVFAVQAGLAALWRSWGCVPAAVCGHSMGEVAAAHAAGILSLEDAACVLLHRTRLLRRLQGQGRMAAAVVSPGAAAELAAEAGGGIYVAAVNSPRAVIFSGEAAAMEAWVPTLKRRGVPVRFVQARTPGHCPLTAPVAAELEQALAGIRPQEAAVPFFSTADGAFLGGSELGAAYWARQLRQPVRFLEAVRALRREGIGAYLEIGPHPVLSSALRDATAEPEGSGMEPASQSPAAGEAPEDLASRGDSASGEDLASPGGFTSGKDLAFRGGSASGEDLASRGGAASRGNLPSRNTSASREVQASLEAPASSEEADFPEEREPLLLSSLRRGEEDASVLLEGLGELYAAGLEPLWSSFYPAGPVLSLPLYPWQRQRHWFELSGVNETDWSSLLPQGTAEERHPHLESGTVFAATGHWVWESVLNTARHPYLQDHCAKGIPLFPAAGYLDIAVAAGRSIQDQAKIELTGVRFREALLLPEGQSRRVQVLVSAPSYGQSSFEIVSRPADEPQAKWTTHADGTIEYRQTGSEHDAEAESAPELLQPDTVLERLNHRMLDVAEHYDRLRLAGGEYGPLFRGMEQLAGGDREALASIRLPRGAANAERHAVHPALLDSAFQAMGGTLQEEEGLYLPVGVDRFTLLESPDDGILWSYAVLEEQAGEEAAGTVRICAEDGRLVAVAEGLRVRRLALAAGSAADDCLYRLDWQPSPALAPSPRKQPVHWLLLADRPGIAELAARELLSRGDICHLAFPGEDYAEEGNNRYRINPADPAHYARLLEQVRWHSGSDLAGVVHLWGTEAEADFTDGEKRIAQEQFLLQSVLELVRCLNADPAALRLWIATRGGCDAGSAVPNPLQASLWGMGATAALELPALSCVLLDLDPEEDLEGAGVWLAQELLAGGSENRIAYRNRQRLVSRLVRWQPEAFSPDSLAAADAGEDDFYLKIAQRGSFDHLQLQEMPRREPGPGELAIRVRASGLNFTDVLNALDLLPIPDRKDVPGWECSGIVEAVGPGVENFREGDEVVALAPWSLGSRVIASALLTVRKPGQMSFADAAGIPAAFLTAYYSLYHIGRLQPGDRVLIHSASGGVGLAALQLSQLAGAEIFATAGTPEKRDYLRSLGVEHVYPSRTLDFAREIRRDTRGEGIDVVLNSLAGEAIEKSLELLRLGGRFLEIGVSDIYNNHRLGLLPFQRSLTYASILLYYICDEQPELLGRMLEDLMELFRQGRLTPLPATPFPASRADEAFRYMTASRHIGKIIVEFGGAPVRLHPNPGKSPVRQDGSYLITGGNTGLGLLTADWLVQQGARFLVLTGRRSAGSETIQAMERWTEQGVRCLSVQADAADGERMQTLFDQMEAELPPLRGIVHAAAVLSDGLLANLDWSQFSDVLRPKTAAAWNLDRLSRDKDLDFFIMYSSAASALGSPGQANYAAANFYLDALASARRRRGLPALSIGWGPWAKVGGAARPDRGGRLSGQGILSLEPETGLAALQRLLASGPAHALSLEADWPKAAESHPGPWPLLHDLLLTPGQSGHGSSASAGHLRSTLLAAPADEAAALLAAELRGTVARILRTAPERLHSSRPLVSLGMDSLMAIELKNWIEHHTGVSLPVSALLQGEGISQLAARIAAELPKGNGAVREDPALSEEAAEAELTGRSHPLTANQLSLWFMHQFSPGSAAYHIPKAVRIPGPLEPESLIRALQGMIRRHPALRTTFVTERKEPVQRIASEAPLSFRAEDVSGWSEAEIENCLREETNRPFDLAAGPLMRACLFSRSPEDHIMLMVFHHIIMDGWSFWIFFKELFELYEAELSGLPPAPSPVSGPYAAYLRACASGTEFTESIAYWTATLEGADPVLRLATDRPRPPVQTFTGASCSEVLDPALSIRVKALAEERGTTLYALLLGAWQTLLHQYTGQEDLVVGTAVAGRNQAYLAGLIGYFVNMLAIRGTFTPGMTYHDALDAAHVRVNEALQYQELPFSRLVQLLRLKRDPARAPLFQASFTWQQAQTDRTGMLDAFALNLPGLLMNSGSLTFESYPLQWQGAMWDLALMMSEVDERLGILMQYNSDLYDERTIRRMIGDFSNLLNEMTVDPTRPIRRLSASTLKE